MRPYGLEVAEVVSRSTVSRNACLVRFLRSSNKCKGRRFGIFWPPEIIGFSTVSSSSKV